MSDYKKSFKQFVKSAEEKLSDGAKKGADFVREKAPKAAHFAKNGADKVTGFAKENASKAAGFAKKSAPVVKDFAKSVGEELHDAGVEIKEFASEKVNAYKNRNNIKVYTSSDVINYESPSEINNKDDEK